MKVNMDPYIMLERKIENVKRSIESKSNHLKQYLAHLYERLLSNNTLMFVQEENLINKYSSEIKAY